MEEGVRFVARHAVSNATTLMEACAANIEVCWGATTAGSLTVGALMGAAGMFAWNRYRGRRNGYVTLGERSASTSNAKATENSSLTSSSGAPGLGVSIL